MAHLIYCGMLIVQYLVLCVDVNTAAVSTTDNVVTVNQCTQDGGYCQNSWDCCSNRCLSFSYKCVKGPATSIYEPNVQQSVAIDPTLLAIDTIEDLVNRFGSDDGDKAVAQSTTTTSAPSTTTSASTSSSAIQHTSTQCIGTGHECADSSQCCSNECLHFLDVHICIQRRTPTTSTTTTTVSPNGQCLLIGQKCQRNEECCTKRCHGYLHQCVT